MPAGSPKYGKGMPGLRPPHFIGRDDDLEI